MGKFLIYFKLQCIHFQKNRTEFLKIFAEKLGITEEELQVRIAETREEQPQPHPPRAGEGWQDRQRSDGLFAELDEETRAALKDDLAKAREEAQARIAGILKSYGIESPQFAGNPDCERPAFMGPPGYGWKARLSRPCSGKSG